MQVAQTIIRLINQLVTDLLEASAARIESAGVASVDDVRATEGRLIGFGPEIEKHKRELKSFLQRHFYQHPRVLEMSDRGARILGELYATFRDEPRHLPAHVGERFALDGEARAISDYVAGMTDRFAMSEHQRLLGPQES